MAKQDGILQIKGTLDNLTFYRSPDGFLVRRKGSVSRDKLRSSASYVRTRENGVEFKECTQSARMLRKSVGVFALRAKDRLLTGRLVKVMTAVKKLDAINVRGARKVAQGLTSAAGKQLLKGFDFNNRAPLSSVVHAPVGLNTTTGAVSLTDFVANEQLQVPLGATHFSLQSAYLNLDFATGVFETCYSPSMTLAIDSSVQDPVLTPVNVPVGTGLKLYFLLVAFYQEVNGVSYPLHNGGHNVLNLLEVL